MVTNFAVKRIATDLLKVLTGQEPSAGEVDNLSDDLKKLLTEKYGVQESRF